MDGEALGRTANLMHLSMSRFELTKELTNKIRMTFVVCLSLSRLCETKTTTVVSDQRLPWKFQKIQEHHYRRGSLIFGHISSSAPLVTEHTRT